jgi:hypothetical protein
MEFHQEKLSSYLSSSEIIKGADRISQLPWYIEIVSKNNLVIQTESYFFILPVKSFLTIDQIIIPPFIQRIDPITKSDSRNHVELPSELIDHFPCGMLSFSNRIQNIPSCFNEQVRTNYFLNLDRAYEDIHKNYNNGHKLNLKHTLRQDIRVSESTDIETFTNHYQKHSHPDIPVRFKEKKLISQLISECIRNSSGKIYIATNPNNHMLATAFITLYNNRMVYLLSSSSPEGKKEYAMYAIIDHIIKSHSNSNWILDFEGSMIPGIAYFMKGFGAEEESYYVYEWNEHWICKFKKWIKRFR